MRTEMEIWDEIAIRVAAALAPQKNMLSAEQVANSAYAVAGAMMRKRADILERMQEQAKKQEAEKEALANGTPIKELDLTVRTQNTLRAESIYTVEQLCERTAAGLIQVPGMGRKSLNEIREILRLRGLYLKGEQPNADQQGG